MNDWVYANSNTVKKERTMTGTETWNSPQKLARMAAIIFLIIVSLGMSAELFFRPGIIVPGDAAATVHNIGESESLFRLSIVSDLIRQMFMLRGCRTRLITTIRWWTQ